MSKPADTDVRAAECLRLKAIFNSNKSSLGLTQKKLATMLGMNQSSVNHYLNGVNPLNASVAVAFARILGVDICEFSERLDAEISYLSQSSGNFGGHQPTGLATWVPIIPLQTALTWITTGQSPGSSKDYSYALCPSPLSKRAFAIRMPDDSMNGIGGDPVIRRGWTVFIEPDSGPKPDQVVLASVAGQDPILGVYMKHGGREYVIPSNPRYEKDEISPGDVRWYLGRAAYVCFEM